MKGHYGAGRGRGILESGFDGRGPGLMGGRMGGGWKAAMLALLLMVIVTLSMTVSKWLVRSKIEALEVRCLMQSPFPSPSPSPSPSPPFLPSSFPPFLDQTLVVAHGANT